MMRAEGRPPLASSKTSSKKEKGCAPDWHFADEADSSKDGSKSSSTGNRERKFIVRGAVVLVLMIGAMYIFNIKETKYLSTSGKHKPSTWFDVKPHWQTTEEMKLRMQTKPKAVDSPHLFPGETADDAEYEHRVDKDEWLDRLDAAAQADMDEEYQNIYEGYGYDDGLLPE